MSPMSLMPPSTFVVDMVHYSMALILGELEQKVMNIIWESDEPLKPAEVLDKMSCGLAYTTIMTILKRLSDKDLLEREKKGKVYFYKAKVKKQKFAKNKLSQLFNSVVNSYGDIAISQFVDSLKSRPEDLKLLKECLEESE